MEKQEDKCEPCPNALQCLVWAGEGSQAKCDNWEYFKRDYVNGPKRKILDAEMDEIEAVGK
jgi:hypothetical protein